MDSACLAGQIARSASDTDVDFKKLLGLGASTSLDFVCGIFFGSVGRLKSHSQIDLTRCIRRGAGESLYAFLPLIYGILRHDPLFYLRTSSLFRRG